MHAQSASKRLAASCVAVAVAAIVVVPAVLCSDVSAATPVTAGSSSVAVSRIVNRWLPVASLVRMEANEWKAQFASVLSLASAHTLSEIDAMTAKSDNDGNMVDKYQRAYRMAATDAGTRLSPSKQSVNRKLGSATSDLVFTPIAPCRVVDTRITGGPLSAGGGLRNFLFYADIPSLDFSIQGGTSGLASSVCPGTVFTGIPPAAAVATITAVGTTGAGNFVVWGGGPLNQIPNTSALNWDSAGDVQANTTVIPAGGRTGGNADFAVIYNGPSGSSQVVVDVIGYFSESTATPLNCQQQTQSGSVPLGLSVTSFAAACNAGFIATGGGCAATGAISVANIVASNPTVNGWNCTFVQGGILYTGTTYAMCCQLPGK